MSLRQQDVNTLAPGHYSHGPSHHQQQQQQPGQHQRYLAAYRPHPLQQQVTQACLSPHKSADATPYSVVQTLVTPSHSTPVPFSPTMTAQPYFNTPSREVLSSPHMSASTAPVQAPPATTQPTTTSTIPTADARSAVNALLSIASASSDSGSEGSNPSSPVNSQRPVTPSPWTRKTIAKKKNPAATKATAQRLNTAVTAQASTPKKAARGRPRKDSKAKSHSPCEKCGKVFFENGQLHRHMKEVHMQLKQFQCRYCFKPFARRFNQRAHEKLVHLKVTDYLCSICNKGFGDKASVAKHERTVHLKQKDFVCDYCTRAFGGKGDLHRHQRLVHKIDTSAFARHTTLVSNAKQAAVVTPKKGKKSNSGPQR